MTRETSKKLELCSEKFNLYRFLPTRIDNVVGGAEGEQGSKFKLKHVHLLFRRRLNFVFKGYTRNRSRSFFPPFPFYASLLNRSPNCSFLLLSFRSISSGEKKKYPRTRIL